MIDKDIFKNNLDFRGSKGVVFYGDKIIVTRRDNKTNFFPLHVDLLGGLKDNNESPFETFKREVREESNIEIDEDSIIYAKKYKSYNFNDMFSYFFVAKLLDPSKQEIKLGNEGLEILLMEPETYINLGDGITYLQELVREYLNYGK